METRDHPGEVGDAAAAITTAILRREATHSRLACLSVSQIAAGERSELTFMVYLNDGFAGGETAFHDFCVTVQPRSGMALLFQHRLLPEGCRVASGSSTCCAPT